MAFMFNIGRVFMVFLLLATGNAVAQETFMSRPSPLAMTTARYKNAYIKVVYSQPQKKGRTVFGGLVPYRQVWRTGANEATELTTTHDLIVNGQTLAAGTYTLFTIPTETSWTIIFNSELGQWDSYNYNPEKNVLTFDVPVRGTGDTLYEAFTIWLDARQELADLHLAWDKTKVTVPIQFTEPKP